MKKKKKCMICMINFMKDLKSCFYIKINLFLILLQVQELNQTFQCTLIELYICKKNCPMNLLGYIACNRQCSNIQICASCGSHSNQNCSFYDPKLSTFHDCSKQQLATISVWCRSYYL